MRGIMDSRLRAAPTAKNTASLGRVTRDAMVTGVLHRWVRTLVPAAAPAPAIAGGPPYAGV